MAVETFDPTVAHAQETRKHQPSDVESEEARGDGLNTVEVERPESLTGRAMRRVANFLTDHAESADARAERTRDRIETARESLRGFGRSALNVLRKTGRITAAIGITTLGVGIVAGQAAGRGIVRGARLAGEATMNAADAVTGFVDDRIEQVSSAARSTVDTVKGAYSDAKVSLGDAYTEAKWRTGNAIEDGKLAVGQAIERGKFEARTKIAELNPVDKIRDKVALKGAEIHDMAFEFGMMRKAYQEKAAAALARRVERIRAFKNRGIEKATATKDAGVEKFNDARDRASRRARRIGHGAMTFFAVAGESGQVFVDNFTTRMKALKEDEATLHGAK